ncbi:hypothetical protein LTR09_003001 [Extremus antarcticus]|uniref:Aminoglycoside phosphotransferase domain-containing protein n=1 Tax=Extremus antarcticus TaxID=702011 RepID=A0AAJ0LUE0_9PEZI|nr:hypothetical protein LTR09_003001 [Extremus antarcticus]
MASSTPSSPDRNAIQRTAAAALQSKSVTVEKLDGYVFRTYRLRTSGGFFYILRCRPSFNIRLLRHEEGWLETEAGTLQTIGGRADIYTPRLIKYHNTTLHIGSCYLISGPFTGSILADVEPTLSSHALASIDRSLGQYVRRLSSMPGRDFGPIRQSQGFPGFKSWAKAFAFLLEAVMRDGEDALISLDYDAVRDLVRRHRGSLDKISQPKLVLLELSADRNVVVDVKEEQVTGLLDFSTAIWGDPFMSDCFYKPTASFAEGFGKLPNRSADERVRQYL